ncbi:MAG: ribonuclease P protein component [Ruminococcaceae bacterium]|nr:ribonuclease P protein component [Oscillospiraceae bacterium]
MNFTVPIRENYNFKRLYTKGQSLATPLFVVYLRRNRLDVNRLGITVSTKIGKAVVRNRARRLLKEAYRLLEPRMIKGYDIVLVARGKTPYVKCQPVMQNLESAFAKLKLIV